MNQVQPFQPGVGVPLPKVEVIAHTESSAAYQDFLEWAAVFCENHNIFIDGPPQLLHGRAGETPAREKIDLIVRIADELYDLWADDHHEVGLTGLTSGDEGQ